MERNIIKYRNVFDRSQVELITFDEFIEPDKSMDDIFKNIKQISDKQKRNDFKRDNLFAVDFCLTNIIRIDIDEIDERTKSNLITKISQNNYVYIIQESVSGNLCVYVKYDRSLLIKYKYWQIYYRLWLDFTLLLETNIDFLPEQNRLAYKSNGQVYFNNKNQILYDNGISVSHIPYINTNKKQNNEQSVRKIAFGSGK